MSTSLALSLVPREGRPCPGEAEMTGLWRLVWVILLSWTGESLAGAWTLPQGVFWGKITVFRQATKEWYTASRQFVDGRSEAPGARLPYNFKGRYESTALFLEGVYGLTGRLDVGVQVPYFDQRFADQTRPEPVADSGLSDLRVFTKIRLLAHPFLLTLKTGAKIPTGEFSNEDGLIPVGEGQWDFDFIVQAGRSFWPLPLYGNVDAGYRVRLENEKIARDPGDEWFFGAELGWNLTHALLAVGKLEMLRSGPSVDFHSIENRSQIKRITYVAPSLLYHLGRNSAVELGMRFTAGGRNFPAGQQLTLGVMTHLGVPDHRP